MVKRIAFTIYVAANMLLCAVLFFPWALPRETVSGLLGRWSASERGFKRRFALSASAVVNAVYFWEADHCYEVYKVERQAREILYP